MHRIGKLDREIYSCITDDIVTDEVIITEEQIQHILDGHPDAYEDVINRLNVILDAPDYIIEDKHPNTGLVIKQIQEADGFAQMVLRICTSQDKQGYKNSIISCWKISEKRLKNYLRNKKILYTKE